MATHTKVTDRFRIQDTETNVIYQVEELTTFAEMHLLGGSQSVEGKKDYRTSSGHGVNKRGGGYFDIPTLAVKEAMLIDP